MSAFIVVGLLILLGGCDNKELPVLNSHDTPFQIIGEKLSTLCWVAYAPTNFDPEKGLRASEQNVREDLHVLRQAGFDGLVTYGTDIMEEIKALPQIAEDIGFEGIILGIWDPNNENELADAIEAGQHNIVLAFVVGNEGFQIRYNYESLAKAMEMLASTTGKPVTTTEQIEDYQNPSLLELGDWIFPNTHPYWHGIGEPDLAVEWTIKQFEELRARTNKAVMLKEVGLPTAGDSTVNEVKQAEYYKLLKDSNVGFVYFEAFDQPWKDHASVEPHWGLFRKDRSPKKVIEVLNHP